MLLWSLKVEAIIVTEMGMETSQGTQHRHNTISFSRFHPPS